MHVIFIKNYKGKLILLSGFVLLWISMFMLSDFLMNNTMAFRVTINNYLTFSYPFELQVVNVFYNEQLENSAIQTNTTYKKPLAQNFSSYKSFEGKFSFQYPSAFTLNEQDFAGSEVLYHIDFMNRSQNSHGFVQVWNMPYSLKEFLERSKTTSLQNFMSFQSKEVTVNGQPGFYWDYISHSKTGKDYRASEVFFKKDDKMYRISYFVPESMWNKSQSDIFWNIVNSFKTY